MTMNSKTNYFPETLGFRDHRTWPVYSRPSPQKNREGAFSIYFSQSDIEEQIFSLFLMYFSLKQGLNRGFKICLKDSATIKHVVQIV